MLLLVRWLDVLFAQGGFLSSDLSCCIAELKDSIVCETRLQKVVVHGSPEERGTLTPKPWHGLRHGRQLNSDASVPHSNKSPRPR